MQVQVQIQVQQNQYLGTGTGTGTSTWPQPWHVQCAPGHFNCKSGHLYNRHLNIFHCWLRQFHVMQLHFFTGLPMAKRKHVQTYGRHRNRVVLVEDPWAEVAENARTRVFGSSFSDSAASNSSHSSQEASWLQTRLVSASKFSCYFMNNVWKSLGYHKYLIYNLTKRNFS